MMTVAVCAGDEAVRTTVVAEVRAAHHTVLAARDGHEALAIFPQAWPDVLVLDVDLPDGDGRDVLRVLHGGGMRVPVLLLSERAHLHDHAEPLPARLVVDVLTKPFEVSELLVRIAALAGGRLSDGPGHDVRLLEEGVSYRGREVRLTPRELGVLAELLAQPGRTVRRTDLAAAGWRMGPPVNDNNLDACIRNLRVKLQSLGETPHTIRTERGVGYRWH